MNLVLLSGGMDSALCLHRYGAALCVGFDYGQPHRIELGYARRIAEHYAVEFAERQLPEIPRIDDVVFAGRNAVLLAHGAAIAQAIGADTVIIGCNMSDARRFQDCRPEFIKAMDEAVCGAYGVRVSAPLLAMTKAQIIAAAAEDLLPPTWTCYAPQDGKPCGECYACRSLLCTA